MSDKFHLFAAAVTAQFIQMSKGELYRVDIEGDALYEAYQKAFPPGTNEVYRNAREHECSTCRAFIKNIGGAVAIINDEVKTVWDIPLNGQDAHYAQVAGYMAEWVRSAPIAGIFRTTEPAYGAAQTKELNPETKAVTIWNHFYGKVAAKHFAGASAAQQIGQANTTAQVFRRGMTEITRDAISTVHSLMTTKDALYRGAEFAFAFGQFVGLKSKFDALTTNKEKELFIWQNLNEPAVRLRNTSFGTLLIDLSEGLDVESAVKKYEKVMAPENYKRPVALITPRMVEDAMKTIEKLGLEPALARRFANINDVSVNDILFVDNALRGKMKDGSVKGLLMDVAAKQAAYVAPAKPEDITIDAFIKDILPKATSMALAVKNEHQANFVSLTAPVNADAPNIFKWPNLFAWSYDGNITDSIKERVKAAGGSTNAALRVSLAWFNLDDLDLHAIEPSKYEIYFGNRGRKSPNGGALDVDMNAGHGSTREAVENIVWDRLTDGTYQVIVHNYSKRETRDPGFTLEVECNGKVMQYSCKSSPSSGASNNALNIVVKGGAIVEIKMAPGIDGRAFSQEKWGIQTETFVKVDTMMLSPNYWGDQGTGNKHYIFVLEGAKNPVPTRGIYNEFLIPELEKHRKVFEVLGNKTMCEPTDQQLSGVGFSSTRGDSVIVKVNNGKTYNVVF